MTSLKNIYKGQMSNLKNAKLSGKIGAKEYFKLAKSIQHVYNTSKKLVEQSHKLNKQTRNLKFNSIKRGLSTGFKSVETAASYCKNIIKNRIKNFILDVAENAGHRTLRVAGTGAKQLIDAKGHAIKTYCNLIPNGLARLPEIQPARNQPKTQGYSRNNRNIAGQITNFPAGIMRSGSRRGVQRLGN